MDRFQTDVTTYQSDLQADNSFLASHRAKNKDVPDYGAVWGAIQCQQRLRAAE